MSRKKLTNGQQNLKKYPYKELAKQLRELRGPIIQKIMAKRLGISLQTYNRYEKGRRKVPDGLLKLARIFAGQSIEKIKYQESGEDEMVMSKEPESPYPEKFTTDNPLEGLRKMLISLNNRLTMLESRLDALEAGTVKKQT